MIKIVYCIFVRQLKQRYMQVSLSRKDAPVTSQKLVIFIDGIEYRITKDIEGLLVINKCDTVNGDDRINIMPSCTNEIKLK